MAWIRRTALLLFIGAVANLAAAQAIGWWSVAIPWEARRRCVAVADQACEAVFKQGFGKTVVHWRVMSPSDAAIWQNVRQGTTTDAPPILPSYDSPASIPTWSSVWIGHRRAHAAATSRAAMSSDSSVSNPTDIAVGWPFRSFVVAVDSRLWGPVASASPPLVVHGGFIGEQKEMRRVLAWQPVIPGAILGTLVWTAALGAAMAAVIMARSAIRTRRNLCVECGYPVGTSPVCTECGKPVRLRSLYHGQSRGPESTPFRT